EPGAVLHDPEAVVTRAVAMATRGVVTAADGSPVALRARSLCLHGDTPGAAGLALRVREALAAAGIRTEAFA
ncbi:LamB/YcsF family protein, partial [Streptomyces sp. SID7760]|nr:LamB/YcsF family protein [Streptomyces sp. SID7760]